MMKRILPVMLILLATILLAGCISIPLGDGEEMTIGFDGISFGEADENDEDANLNGENEEVYVDDDVNMVDAEPDTEVADDQDNDLVIADDDSNNDGNMVDDASCEDDYSLILDDMPADFPMPACATITSVKSSSSYIDAYYSVEADWKDIFKLYQDYFGDKITSQTQKPEEENGKLQSKTDEHDIYIEVDQNSDDSVTVRVLHYFVEEE